MKKNCRCTKTGLEENGFSVQVAYDGNIALKIFRSQPHQLIIADINLPGMNGYDLCKAIRAADPSVPLIMLTAMNALEDKIEGFDAGQMTTSLSHLISVSYLYVSGHC